MESERNIIYLELRKRMEKVGFVFEREQKPHFQSKRDKELKFIHPGLEEKFEKVGERNNAKKFYLKPLSDIENGEIGLTTGRTSPLYRLKNEFPDPNAVDSFKNERVNAWVNREGDSALDFLLDSIENYLSISLNELNDSFIDEVNRSLDLDPIARAKKLESAEKFPSKVIVKTVVYKRNPDIVAAALIRAKGVCESCKSEAPFIRKKDNSPYLEVNHVEPLSAGGEDSLENVIALCPNCHREKHFG